MAPPADELSSIVSLAASRDIQYRICFDVSGYFESLGDSEFIKQVRYFYLDEKGTPQYVGDPLRNEKSLSLFNDVINGR